MASQALIELTEENILTSNDVIRGALLTLQNEIQVKGKIDPANRDRWGTLHANLCNLETNIGTLRELLDRQLHPSS